MSAKFTPGPYWLETKEGIHTIWACDQNGRPFEIAYECVYGRGVGHNLIMDECAAVFNLFAAAPTIYKALALAERAMSNSPATFEHELPLIQEALRKADGEQS